MHLPCKRLGTKARFHSGLTSRRTIKGMQPITDQQRTVLEIHTRFLRARERSLQHLAQSTRCSMRPEAELELHKIREQLADTYAQMRHDYPTGYLGSGSPQA